MPHVFPLHKRNFFLKRSQLNTFDLFQSTFNLPSHYVPLYSHTKAKTSLPPGTSGEAKSWHRSAPMFEAVRVPITSLSSFQVHRLSEPQRHRQTDEILLNLLSL